MINCRPHYLPREFSAILFVAVYLPPQTDAGTKTALSQLYKEISKQETTHPEAALLVTGYFNAGKLKSVLPNLYQHVRCLTRGKSNYRSPVRHTQRRIQSSPSPSIGSNTSATLILNTGAPQGCVLIPLLYYLLTHDCMARHNSNTIIKFSNDTTVVELITDSDETSYREEIRDLAGWCQNNNLSFNVTKTKEMIVDCKKRSTEHIPVLIDGAVVEQVESFKFLGVHINNKLDWSKHTKTIVKRSRQSLFP